MGWRGVLALGAIASVMIAGPVLEKDGPVSAEDRKLIEGIVSTYISEHPELLVKALYAARDKEEAQKALEAQQYLDSHIQEVLTAALPYTTGTETGLTTLVFVDYQCGFCHKLYKQLQEAPVPGRVAYIQTPVLGSLSVDVARVALSASPAIFSKVNAALFAQDHYKDPKALAALKKKYKLVVASDAMLHKILSENKLLAEKIGVQGVPAVIVTNGTQSKLILGLVDVSVIKEALSTLSGKPAVQEQESPAPAESLPLDRKTA